MNIYHLWVKEYSDVSWIGFSILFIISILPMLIKKIRNWPVMYLQGYNFLFNFLIVSMLQPARNPPIGSGDTNFIFAFFLAFGIGYSLLYFRKEEKTPLDRNLSVLSFFIFLLMIIILITSQLKYF